MTPPPRLKKEKLYFLKVLGLKKKLIYFTASTFWKAVKKEIQDQALKCQTPLIRGGNVPISIWGF